jgi:hypothetical protein
MYRWHAGLIATTFGLLGLAAASCGGDGLFGPDGRARGTMSASGALAASGEGLAFFQSISSRGGGDMFQLSVAPVTLGVDVAPRAVWHVQIARYAQRPVPGTYQIVPSSPGSSDPSATFYYTNSDGSLELFGATSGELVITSSSPTSVRGTFTFFATSATNETRSVTVQGTFTAVCPPGATCL